MASKRYGELPCSWLIGLQGIRRRGSSYILCSVAFASDLRTTRMKGGNLAENSRFLVDNGLEKLSQVDLQIGHSSHYRG